MGRAVVVGGNVLVLDAVMVVQGDIELVGESINYGSANAQAGEGAGAGHEFDLGDVLPGFVVGGEFVFDKLK